MKRNYGNLLFGLLVVIVGLALLTNNLGWTDLSIMALLFKYWPVFVIVGGIGLLLNHGSKGEIVSGIVILLLGAALMLRNLGYIHFSLATLFRLFWPILLIVMGVAILTGRRSSGKSNLAFMGGIDRTKSAWNLEETAFVAVMGGIELDFRLAEIPEGITVIDLTTIMGGIEVKVPKDIEVECNGVAILGGVEMLGKTTGGIISNASSVQIPPEPSTKKLIFHCRAIMGGVVIKASS